MITASIVTYKNNAQVLSRTIESYLSATNGNKLYVIDNSPNDSVRSSCNHPSIQYHNVSSNVGYGRGHNIVLRDVLETSKYHLILNPDVYFEPHVINELTSFMDLNEDVGLIMPKVLYPDGRLQPLCKLLPSPGDVFARRLLNDFKTLQDKINYKFEMHFTGYNTIAEVPFLSGCFMLVRTSVLKKVGLFDERFFLYFEDTDLSRRIHEHAKTIYYPKAHIYHVHERGQYKDKGLFYQGLKSAVQYFSKWGWIDNRRRAINQNTIAKFKLNGYQWNFKH